MEVRRMINDDTTMDIQEIAQGDEWEGNRGARKEGDKGMKGIQERKGMGKG
jgi:hypothetical protein